ncbi:hypothetical protein [Bacillus sp. ISL-57]|uniref:hypothetical protein n=2 Tax=Bacillus TaxID=1386 RepID=UPI0020350B8D|nr:hypothetical protein [Bacillus sp. ISL-57]
MKLGIQRLWMGDVRMMNSKEYLESLRDGQTVFLNGDKVDEVAPPIAILPGKLRSYMMPCMPRILHGF